MNNKPIDDALKGKIIITKEKPKTRTIEQISAEREKREKEAKIEEAANDINNFFNKIAEKRKEAKGKKKPSKLRNIIIFVCVVLIGLLALNLFLLNIWALKTLVQQIIGWFI